MLSSSSLCYSFYKNAQFLQTLISSHTHSYYTNAKSIISCRKRKYLFKMLMRKNSKITSLYLY